MKILVIAGGQGTKLWPYSRQDKPKQFQPIIGEKTSYEENIETLLEAYSAEDIFVSTKRRFIKYVSEQSPQIPLKNYIVEPDIAKDRGPGEGLAFLKLSMLFPEEPFFVVQADCIREPRAAFLQMIKDAEQIVTSTKMYVTAGIKATKPNMGADYLKLGEKIKGSGQQEAYSIDEFMFRRKTLRETKELVENYHVVAHCNHACWYPQLMLDAYKQYRPDWYKSLMEIKEALDQPGESEAIERIYDTMEPGSTEEVTKHIMKDGKAAAVLLPFKWTDVGTWGSVYEFFGNGGKNYTDGNVLTVNSTGSLVKSSDKKKLIAVAGLHDVVVIDTEDVLLIIPKDKIEHIKDIQKELTERQQTEYM